MRDAIGIALIGGDMRQVSAAEELSRRGFSTKLWGIDKVFCRSSDVDLYETASDAVEGCSVVVLPLPVSDDGNHVYTPLLGEKMRMKLSSVLNLLLPNTVVFGGRVSPMIGEMITSRGFSYFDYFLREELQIKNAVPTAEGAIALAMNELPITLFGAKAAVVGYGRIGKMLGAKLHALGADVTVFARKPADIAMAGCCGASAMSIEEGLRSLSRGYDVIFNTVPVQLIDKSVVERIPKQTLMIDLASAPGGIDMAAAKQRDLKVIWALSLPGKNSPYTAGKIIAETVEQILREERIVT